MHDAERTALKAAVELLHACEATFVHSDIVRVTSGSVTIQRDVAVFALTGPGTPAPLAYAWIDSNSSDRDRARHQVVLHSGVVKSPEHAVAGFYLAHASATDTAIRSEGVNPYPEY